METFDNESNLVSTHLMRYAECRARPQQRGHHSVLRVGMDAASSTTQIKCIPK
jgi:hypothetical protein